MSDDQTRSLYYQAKLRAIENILNDDDLSFYKKITRWYSTTFATPLLEVRQNIPFISILQEYYESTMEDTDFNDVYEYAMRDMLPEFMEEFEESDVEFAESMIEEQKAGIERKRKRDMKLKDTETIEIEEEVLETKPTSDKPEEISLSFDNEEE
jgi:hypothetical protein